MKVAIIGVGLIGGSLALALKNEDFASTVIGVDHSPENIRKALELGIIDRSAELKEAVETSDLVLVAVPVNIIRSLLPSILDLVNNNQVVMEMGSTKEEILNHVDGHPNRGRLIASHPMAGTEYSGPEAAIADLFSGRNMVFCDVTRSDDDAFEVAETVCEKLKMNPIFMHAKEQDLHTADVSHISHISSCARALTVLEKERSQGRIFELAGGGFASTVRLAKSSPETWVPIFQQNQSNLLEVLDEHIKQLQHMREVLKKEDYDMMYKLIKQSNKIKRIIK